MGEWYLILLPAAPAVMMSVSDFRERSVTVFSVIAFAMCSFACSFVSDGLKGTFVRTGSNLALLAVFYGLLVLYYRIREVKFIGILDRSLGKGDAAFLAVSGILLESYRFCLFLAASCLTGILWARLRSQKEIPFVGLGVPVLFLFLSAEYI